MISITGTLSDLQVVNYLILRNRINFVDNATGRNTGIGEPGCTAAGVEIGMGTRPISFALTAITRTNLTSSP